MSVSEWTPAGDPDRGPSPIDYGSGDYGKRDYGWQGQAHTARSRSQLQETKSSQQRVNLKRSFGSALLED